MYHPDKDINAAIIALADALCQHERSTGNGSVLIIRTPQTGTLGFMSGKPVPHPMELLAGTIT